MIKEEYSSVQKQKTRTNIKIKDETNKKQNKEEKKEDEEEGGEDKDDRVEK